MKRRDFSLAAVALGTLGTAGTRAASAQQGAFTEGKDYIKLRKPAPTSAAAGQVEVVEFFWYRCGHCHTFEPTFAAWAEKAPADVLVQRVPVGFQAGFIPEQKLYYTLETLGLVASLHTKVFHAANVERKPLMRDADIFAWAGKQPGVDLDKFKEVYNSFSVANQVRRATQLQDDYAIEGTPAVGVAGRYWTDGTRARSMERVMQVVDHLVETMRKA